MGGNLGNDQSAGCVSRVWLLVVLAPAALLLGGCVASMAASAAGMAVRAAQGAPHYNEAMQPEANSACRARAAQYGAAHIIDVEQHTPVKIIVWGTVDDGTKRRSFKCEFGTKINAFKLREISLPK